MKKLVSGLCIAVCCIGFYFSLQNKPKAPFLSVVGFCKMADGLGRQCPDLIEALYQDFSVGFYPLKSSSLADVPDQILPIINHPNPHLGTVVFYNDSIWMPKKKGKDYGVLNLFKTKKHDKQLRICYSMLESTKIPKQWVSLLNEYFDLAAVPDPFLEKVYKDSGVTIPIFTVPLGLNLKQFLDQPIKTAYNKIFRFGCMGLLNDRKNQKKLIEAFDIAFKDTNDVELVVHSRYADKSYLKEFNSLLLSLNNPRIFFQNNTLDNKAYLEFFKSVDMLVNVSKGEGFSIQPREALCLGIPVLISDNTAQSSIIKHAYVQPCITSIAKPCYYTAFHEHVGENFDCELDDLVAALKEAYDNRDLFLQKAEQNRTYASCFDYKKIKAIYKNLIKPQVCLLGDSNQILDNGIQTDSLELKIKYEKLTGANL